MSDFIRNISLKSKIETGGKAIIVYTLLMIHYSLPTLVLRRTSCIVYETNAKEYSMVVVFSEHNLTYPTKDR